MTLDDIGAAIELIEEVAPHSGHNVLSNAEKTCNSLATKVADTEKNRNIDVTAVIFLRQMQQLGGTFAWTDGPKVGYKFANVFEALAATMPAFDDLGLIAKGAYIEEVAPKLRSGFYSARKWLEKWYGDTVYCVPQHNESSLPTVITLDHDYILDCGKTSSQMQAERDFKLADGQVRASTRRLAASTKQKSEVETKLAKIMARAIRELDHQPTRRELA